MIADPNNVASTLMTYGINYRNGNKGEAVSGTLGMTNAQ